MDLRPSFEAAQGAFGTPAVVTLPDADASVETVAVWFPASTEVIPVGVDVQRAEAKNVLALSLADVPQVPRGTVVLVAAVDGGDVLRWVVDGTERVEFDCTRLVVIASPEEES